MVNILNVIICMAFHYPFLYKWIENTKGFIDDDNKTEDVLFSIGINLGIGVTSTIHASSIYLIFFIKGKFIQ